MFQTADTLLGKEGRRWLGAHVISFDWEGFQPRLVLFDQRSGELEELELEVGHTVDWRLSEEKVCTGRFEEGRYVPCHRSLKVSIFDQCRECASSWIGMQECVFEPQCDGERCGSAICRKEHAIYMAFVGPKAKIGMTTSARLIERGIEQGADAIGRLAVAPNRRRGRELENTISRLLSLPQVIRVDEAVRSMMKRPDADGMARMYNDMGGRLRRSIGVEPGALVMLERYPVRPEHGHLSRRKVAGRHVGEVVGVKGKLLAYRGEDGACQVVQASSLPSHYLRRARAKG
jgi:hypothetical protein